MPSADFTKTVFVDGCASPRAMTAGDRTVPKKHRETDAVERAGKASFGQHGTDGIPSDEGHKPAGQRDQGSHPGAAGADT